MARRGPQPAADLRDAAAVDADMVAQESGPNEAAVPKVSPVMLHRTHPDTGLDVVFVPGELLPDWVEVGPDA
jgi:hypothetical protein